MALKLKSISRIQSEKEKDEPQLPKNDLYQILASDIDESLLKEIIEVLRKEKIQDLMEFFEKLDNQNFIEREFNGYQKKIKRITNLLRNILDNPFSKNNFSTETYKETRQDLIKKIQGIKRIIEVIIFLVQLTGIDKKFIQCGSNGLYLLVIIKINFSNENFENIKIKDTTLIGGNFVRCNLSGLQFENVDIFGMNLNQALLFNCQWKSLKIQELNKLDSHTRNVQSISFSPDGITLASDSKDKAIRLWDVIQQLHKDVLHGHFGQAQSVGFSPGSYNNSIRFLDVKTLQKYKGNQDGHNWKYYSVCFSPDGAKLASCSYDFSISLWNVKTGQQVAKFIDQTKEVYSICFSPDGTTLAFSDEDKSIRLRTKFNHNQFRKFLYKKKKFI